MSQIKGIAVDLEGTVVDVERAHFEGHCAAAAEFGLVLTVEEAITALPHFIGGPDEKVCEEIRDLLPARGRSACVEDILARDKFHYLRLLPEIPIECRPGFMEAYHGMRDLGLTIATGSLTPMSQAAVLLERSGLMKVLGRSNIVLREDVKNPKPAPDVFLRTAQIMGIDPSEQIVFEDSPRGIRAALSAGSRAVGMPVIIRPQSVAALVEAGASMVFFDWREINVPALIQNMSR